MVWQRSAIMKKALQQTGWISGTRHRTVNGALVLALLMVPTVMVTRSVQAQSFSVLYSFTGGTGAALPVAGLAQDKEGNLYGTTLYGGTSGAGTVFKLDTAGTETVLHSFTGPDGVSPGEGLVRDKEGNLYGITTGGGTTGVMTMFKLDTTTT